MNRPNVRLAVLGLLVGGALLPVLPARAQDLSPALDPVMVGQGLVLSSMMHAQAERDAARLRKKGRAPVVTVASARTRFTPSVARRKAQSAKFLSTMKRLSPEIAGSLAPAFQGDPVKYAAPFLAKYGARTDDVADLTAVYLVSSWYGANGKTGDPTRANLAAVSGQIRRMYAASPKLRGASDATKQNVGEGSLYLSMFNTVLIATMKAHPEAKSRLAAEIAAGAKSTYGLDLRAMKLTSAGLVR